MKKLIWITFMLIGFNNFSFAQKGQQAIGVFTGLNNTFSLNRSEFSYDPFFENSFFSPVAGMYYSNDLTKRLGVNFEVRYLAKNYTYTYKPYHSPEPDSPMKIKLRSSYFEVPVNFTLNLNKKEQPTFRSYFILGYTYSRFLQIKRTNITNGTIDYIELYSDEVNNHYINTGYEIRRKISENYTVAFNPYFRYHIIRRFYPGQRHNIGFELKFGRIL